MTAKKGYLLITGPEGTQEADTLTCKHCQWIWRVQRGSGAKRGWCMNCGGATCGKPACSKECRPFMREIEKTERRDSLMRGLGIDHQ